MFLKKFKKLKKIILDSDQLGMLRLSNKMLLILFQSFKPTWLLD